MSIQTISLSSLHAGPHEQRFSYHDDAQEDLQASIAAHGVQIPLIVVPDGDGYLILDGHRRRQALEDLGIREAVCDVRESDPHRNNRTAFIANFLRKDPTPVELATAIARAVAQGVESEEEIARTLHRSLDWVRRQLAMLDWPDDVLAAIHAGHLSIAAASNLAPVTDDTYRAFLLDHAVNNGATARTTAAWLQQWMASRPPAEAVAAEPLAARDMPPRPAPQTPCFGCGRVHRTDELSHLPLCVPCINRLNALRVT